MILLGSTFPLTLIRRRTVIAPASLDDLRSRLQAEGFVSFWGHDNTCSAAQAVLGVNPQPNSVRPALTLDPDNVPVLDGQTFEEVWVLSPEYVPGFRPEIGKEVPAGKIKGWQTLRIAFCDQPKHKD